MMNRRKGIPGMILAITMVTTLSSFADEKQTSDSDQSQTPAEQILGKWVQYRETNRGRIKTIKEHRGDHTFITAYDPDGNLLYKHRSEYEVDDSGAVTLFRYTNKVALLGPNAGARDERDHAYIFRIEGDLFYEVHGLLESDTGKPLLIVWERSTDDSKEVEDAESPASR